MSSKRSVVVDGLEIAYEDTGGAGPTIVLCHGSSSSRRAFEPQIRGLADRFRVVALDLPGHGDSERSTTPDSTYAIPGYTRVFVGFARALGLERSVFVGWSTGGHVVLNAGLELPNALGLFLFGAAPIGKPPPIDRMYVKPEALGAGFHPNPTENEIRALLAMYFHRTAPVPEVFYDDFVRTDPRTREVLAATIARLDYEDELAFVDRLRPQLALVHGAEEAIMNRAYFDELRLEGVWRGGVQVLPGVGHASHWEDPAAFDALLADFTSERARAAAA